MQSNVIPLHLYLDSSTDLFPLRLIIACFVSYKKPSVAGRLRIDSGAAGRRRSSGARGRRSPGVLALPDQAGPVERLHFEAHELPS